MPFLNAFIAERKVNVNGLLTFSVSLNLVLLWIRLLKRF